MFKNKKLRVVTVGDLWSATIQRERSCYCSRNLEEDLLRVIPRIGGVSSETIVKQSIFNLRCVILVVLRTGMAQHFRLWTTILTVTLEISCCVDCCWSVGGVGLSRQISVLPKAVEGAVHVRL